MSKIRNKRGVTPVIANILLIAIAIVLAAIVFIWARGFVQEGLQKQGEPVERACERASFDADIHRDSSGAYVLEINNRENVPLYGFNLYVASAGQEDIEKIAPLNIDVGESQTISLPEEIAGAIYSPSVGSPFEVNVVPIIAGSKGDQIPKEFACDDKYGVSVEVDD